jgi:hypothetical protein
MDTPRPVGGEDEEAVAKRYLPIRLNSTASGLATKRWRTHMMVGLLASALTRI